MGYYVGSVGKAQAFMRTPSGKLEHYFDAKTLTESTINISISNEDVRGGDGGRLLGKYFHTTSFKVTLTDVVFNLKYISALVGSDITIGDGSRIIFKKSECIIELFGALSDQGDDHDLVLLDDTNELLATAETNEKGGCDVEIKTVKNCRQIKINSNYKPRELVLFLKTKLFMGNNKIASMGIPIGDLTIEIPRFQLDGELELPLSSSGATNVQITGTVLAGGMDSCGQKWYSKISEFISCGFSKYSGYTSMVIANQDKLYVGSLISVYAVGPNKTPKKMEKGEYFISGTAVNYSGEITGIGTVKVKTDLFKCSPISITLG